MTGAEPEILIRVEGRAGRITLNRPKALNALTYPQVGQIAAALDAWERVPDVHLVVIDGTGGRAFCAGGDVRAMYDARTEGSAFPRRFWRDEYRLNARIHRYAKPYVALMDGIVMGGGIGLSAHGRHRIVTERSVLAMPETAIGLIPDVGGTWLLSRGPGFIGTYLALTGARMTGSDAIQAGLADAFVPSERLGALAAALTGAEGDEIEDVIAEHEAPIPPSALAANGRKIDRWFAGETIEAIMAELNTTTDPLAQSARADLLTKSPTALKVTLAALAGARSLASLEEALRIELRLVVRLFESGEFIEGVRALIVDKDRQPRWRPATLEEVTPEIVAAHFAPFADGDELSFR